MPIYEYKCQSCGKVFTKIQKFSDEPLTSHEECGSGPVEKLLSIPAFHFKGTGFYITDYGKGGASDPKNKSEGGSKEEGGSSSNDKDASKPAETKPSSDSATPATPTPAPAAKTETKPVPTGS